MAGDEIVFTQINLHHSKGASTALVRRMAKMHTGICLIQEPWLVAGRIRGLGGAGRIYRDPTCSVPRAYILVKGFDDLLLPARCNRDLTAIKIKFPVGGCSEREVMVASGYFLYDSQEEPPPREVQDLVEHCRQRSIPLILGCDANAHHIVWDSSNTNGRGDALLQYLVKTSLCIMNRGRETTFYNSVRSEVIDLTLCTVRIEGWVGSWRVSNEPSLSDHRYIQFEWKERCSETRAFRNPRKTDWAFFRENLRNELQSFKPSFGTTDELDHWAFELGEIVNISFQRSCPLTIPKGTWGTPWWNWELEDLRRETGRTFNRAKNTRNSVDWRIHREAQRLYKNCINAVRIKGWRDYCEDIERYPDVVRLLRILAKNPEVWLEAIRLPTGEYTTSEEEYLKLLPEANFPGFRLSHEMGDESSGRNRQQRAAWDLASKVVIPEKVKWAIRNFQPFKAPGIDGICPAFLQEGLEELVVPLVKLFRASVALAHVPEI
ncbi:uncharacterized protein LOC116416999 [Nasonia vitripennis]|uniref:Endonuclease/exonuclease/phosphatase domain-containing protein n=1 Tax=Nasonia vitripennis TaxID=7425 RepID=A0A7M7QB36_NASVI|nr:uncharacterized protein LOC116416999 [Nasonia vitripennis]